MSCPVLARAPTRALPNVLFVAKSGAGGEAARVAPEPSSAVVRAQGRLISEVERFLWARNILRRPSQAQLPPGPK
jgi:hypothetical protein